MSWLQRWLQEWRNGEYLEPTPASRRKFLAIYGAWLLFYVALFTLLPAWLTGDGRQSDCEFVARGRWLVLGISAAALAGSGWCLRRAWRLWKAKIKPLRTDALWFRTRLVTGWIIYFDVIVLTLAAPVVMFLLAEFWLAPDLGQVLFSDDGCQATPWYAWFDSPTPPPGKDCPPPAP